VICGSLLYGGSAEEREQIQDEMFSSERAKTDYLFFPENHRFTPYVREVLKGVILDNL
jgi:hypothetical protein